MPPPMMTTRKMKRTSTTKTTTTSKTTRTMRTKTTSMTKTKTTNSRTTTKTRTMRTTRMMRMRTSNHPADGASTSSALLAGSPGPLPPQSLPGEEDQDTGDIPAGVDEDELNDDPLDTDQITSPE